jgi:hypothetical protein
MIEKVANNKFNTEKLNLNPPDKVKEKLDYYRTFFNKTQAVSSSLMFFKLSSPSAIKYSTKGYLIESSCKF